MHERQSPLVARGASPTMNSQHLTLHAVDLVALDGEVSWQWEDYFRVAAAMQAAAHELEVSGVLGRLLGLALGDRVPEDGFPECSHCLPGNRPARNHSWTARISSCRGPAGIIDWIKTTQGWRRSWPRSSRPCRLVKPRPAAPRGLA